MERILLLVTAPVGKVMFCLIPCPVLCELNSLMMCLVDEMIRLMVASCISCSCSCFCFFPFYDLAAAPDATYDFVGEDFFPASIALFDKIQSGIARWFEIAVYNADEKNAMILVEAKGAFKYRSKWVSDLKERFMRGDVELQSFKMVLALVSQFFLKEGITILFVTL
jgi:hypothetical protein